MITYPSGTILVKKVNENDDFVEEVFNSEDLVSLGGALASGVVTITGAQTITGQKTLSSDLLYTGLPDFSIVSDTTDGSDNLGFIAGGGGDIVATRGAIIAAYGNENITHSGSLILAAGDGDIGEISLQTDGNEVWKYDKLGYQLGTQVTNLIGTDTEDGANNARLVITAGNDLFAGARGAWIVLAGNEHANNGDLRLGSGDGFLQFYTSPSSTLRWYFENAGNFIPATSGTYNIGTEALPVSDTHSDQVTARVISAFNDATSQDAEGDLRLVSQPFGTSGPTGSRGGAIIFNTYSNDNDTRHWSMRRNSVRLQFSNEPGIICGGDGSQKLVLQGGLTTSTTPFAGGGAYLQLFGNTHSTDSGLLHISSGNLRSQYISFYTGTHSSNRVRWQMLGTQNAVENSILAYNQDAEVRATTTSGSDDRSLTLAGGGDAETGFQTGTTIGRGAIARLYGNDNTEHPGSIRLLAGVISGTIDFETFGAPRWQIANNGDFIPQVSGTLDIGSDSLRVANLYVDNIDALTGTVNLEDVVTITGTETITGDKTFSADVTLGNDLIFTNSTPEILMDANNKVLQLGGGGQMTSTSGAMIWLHGADHATQANELQLYSQSEISMSSTLINLGGGSTGWSISGSILQFSDSEIRARTQDGSDNKFFRAAGGGDFTTTRGASIVAGGNESPFPGQVRITGGNVSGGLIRLVTSTTEDIQFYTNNNLRWSVDSGGDLLPGTSGTLDIGTASLPVGTIYADNIVATVNPFPLANNTFATWDNQADSGQINALKVDDNDDTVLNADSGNKLLFQQAESTVWSISGSAGYLRGHVTDNVITTSTIDGADSARLILSSNDGLTNQRGGVITIHGEQHANTGDVTLTAGIDGGNVNLNATGGFVNANTPVVFTGSDKSIRSDGATSFVSLQGGTGAASSLGGSVYAYGISHSTRPGQVWLSTGNGADNSVNIRTISTGDINFYTVSALKWAINGVSGSLVPSASGTYDIGSTDNPVATIYADEFISQGSPGLKLTHESGFGIVDTTEDNDLRIRRNGTPFIQLENGQVVFTQDVIMEGDLNVSGINNIINTEQLLVEDNIITLNSSASGSPSLDAGIEVNRGASTYAQFLWDESEDYWTAGLSGSLSKVILASDDLTALSVLPNNTYLQISGTSSAIDVLKVDSSNNTVLAASSGNLIDLQINSTTVANLDEGLFTLEPDPSNDVYIGTNGNAGSTPNILELGTGTTSHPAASRIQLHALSVTDAGYMKLYAGSRQENYLGEVLHHYHRIQNNVAFTRHTSATPSGSAIVGDANTTALMLAGGGTFDNLTPASNLSSYMISYGNSHATNPGDLRLGAGNAGDILLQISGSTAWSIGADYALLPSSSGSHDIGSATNPIRTLYVDNISGVSLGATFPLDNSEYVSFRNANDDATIDVLTVDSSDDTSLEAARQINFTASGTNQWSIAQDGRLKAQPQVGYITQTTEDGSDDSAIYIAGGGDVGGPRGAYIRLFGNDFLAVPGHLKLDAGSDSSSEITFSQGNQEKWAMRGDNIVCLRPGGSLHQSTDDGDDDGLVGVGGGGALSPYRGAYATFYGNENAVSSGTLVLAAGVTSSSQIQFKGNDSDHWYMEGTTGHFIPEVSGTKNIGEAATPVGEIHVDTLYASAVSGVELGSGTSYAEETTTSGNLSANTEYAINNASTVTMLLPSTATAGDKYRLIQKGVGKFRVTQNSGQVIHFGDSASTSGTSGYLESQTRYDVVEIQCVTDDTEFVVVSSIGNLTLI